MGSIILALLKETTLTLLGKVAWKAVFERFYTRLVIYGLEKIINMSSNNVVKETLNDILVELGGKKLKVVDDCIKELNGKVNK